MEFSGKDIALELFEDILDDVFGFYQKKMGIWRASLKKTIDDNNPENPLVLINVLNLFEKLPSKCLLIKSKAQYSESLCGFHALFYAKTVLSLFLNCKTLNDQLISLINLQSDASFWRFYQDALNRVLKCPFLDSLDVKDLKNMGPLDASHLDYLISEGVFSEYPVRISSLFYGYGYFQCGVERIEASEELMKGKTPGFSLIFLGITSHWMLYLNGFPSSGEAWLFDSRKTGACILGDMPSGELLEIEESERMRQAKKPMTKDERRVFESNVIDGRFLLSVLEDVKNGKYSLKSVFVNRVVFDKLRNYEKEVNGVELGEYDFEGFSLNNQEFTFEIIEKSKESVLKEAKRAKQIAWFTSQEPPRVIREDLLDVLKRFGKEHLIRKTAFFLEEWMKEVELLLDKSEENGLWKDIDQLFADLRAFI